MTSDWCQNLSRVPFYKDFQNDQKDFSSKGVQVIKSCKMWYFMSNSYPRP